MNITFIDPATVCGVATGKPGNCIAFDLKLQVKKAPFVYRLARLRQRLEEMHAASPIELIAYESSRFLKSADASFCYGAIVGTLELIALDHGIPVVTVPVATLKKFATGKGNAKKQDMIAAVREWGYEPESHNAADAIAGWHFMQVHHAKPAEEVAPATAHIEGAAYDKAAE